MEASEKPQLPLDNAPSGTVRALEDRLVIEQLTVTDERAAQLVRDRREAGENPARTVANAIEIGARVLDREDAAAEVDYVRAEFEKQAGELRTRLSRALEEGDRALAERITRAFDNEQGSVPRQFQQRLEQALAEQRTALLKQFSKEDGANPLNDFKAGVVRALRELGGVQQNESEQNRKRIEQLTREIVELKQQREADARVAEEAERGTAKGRSFEERVHDAIEQLAATRGDCAHHLGDQPGAGGSKKGDSMVEIGGGEGASLGRIVFEIKDRQLTKPKAWEELNGAIAAREADYAVLVVAGEDALPTGDVDEMHEYQGNKLVVAVDPEHPGGRALELAYRYACLRVRAAKQVAAAVDSAAIAGAISEARDVIGEFRNVKTALTTASKGVDRARDGVESIEGSLLDRFERVEQVLAQADAESAS
jgi:Uncharacterized protein conserved in bacteria (DUF2130)